MNEKRFTDTCICLDCGNEFSTEVVIDLDSKEFVKEMQDYKYNLVERIVCPKCGNVHTWTIGE